MYKVFAFVIAFVGCSTEGSPDSPSAKTPGSAVDSAAFAMPSVPRSGKAQTEWDFALSNIRRLDPETFANAPEAFRSWLVREGCTIPQVYHLRDPHNLVPGEFAVRGQKDWAALCSRNDTSEIVIWWGGPAKCPSRIASAPDVASLQTVVDGIGYSRQISTVDKAYIDKQAKAHDGPTPPDVDHDGIDDAFSEKASIVRFCNESRWLRLQGAD